MKSANGLPANKQLWARRRETAQSKIISASQETWVKTRFIGNKELPLVVEPAVDGVNLLIWAGNNQSFIRSKLKRYGAILFRGFDVYSQDDFEKFVSVVCPRLMHYVEGATPRTQLTDKVYTSTEYPADQVIALHNELAYVKGWPMDIFFYCQKPAEEGGETPIADVRKVLERIDPAVAEKFRRRGWMLVRNFGEGLSLSWQKAFRSEAKSDVEKYFDGANIEYEWREGERLRTRQTRPAIAAHPETGEEVWFNHVAFWHESSLEEKLREAMRAMFEKEELPYNTYYGDGGEISEEEVQDIRKAYAEETVMLKWEEKDVIMVDNMLVAHGRNWYKGSRRILVSMGQPHEE